MGTTLVSGQDRTLHLEVMRIPVQRPFTWLRDGWLQMRSGARLRYWALIVQAGWTILVFCGTHPYFIAAAISGFLLVGPLMSAGLCEMSRRYSLGQSANFDESLDGFARNRHALFEFGAILALSAVVWFGISAVMLASVSTNRSQVLAYIALGGALAAAVFAVSVVAIPLIIDRHATAGQAMRASVRVVFSNIPAMIVWSALILILTIIGYATLL